MVEEFKYLGATLINQNYIQEGIKSRLKSGNAWSNSVQNLLSSRSLTLRQKRRLRVFENRVLRRIFWPRWDKVTGE